MPIRNMCRTRALAMLCVSLPLLWVSSAQGEPTQSANGSSSSRWLSGTRPGEPSTIKLAAVSTLYAASVLGLSASAYFGVRSLSERGSADTVRDRAPVGFCSYGSRQCDEYLRLRREQNVDAHRAWFFLGGSAVSAISGVLLAELWPNRPAVTLSASASPKAAGVVVRLGL